MANIAIVGCGPAGMAAALLFDRQGHQVTLLERFDAPRPLGSGIILQPTGLAVLRELDLAEAIHNTGHVIERMHGVVMPAAKTVLNVDYSALGEGFHGVAVHRAALFDVLYDAVVARGIKLESSLEIIGVTVRGSSISGVDASGGETGPFDLLVDASGARSKLQSLAVNAPRRRELVYGAIWGSFTWPGAPFDEHVLQQRYVGAHTMIGVLPIGRHAHAKDAQAAFFWSLKATDYERWCRAGLESWKRSVRSIWPDTESILEQITNSEQMSLARYGHSTMRRPFGERIVFIGDAAHSTSPQLGQGANMALLDAWVLSEVVTNNDIPSALQAYALARRWHVRAFQISSLAMTPFYQSDSRVLAALRDLLFEPVAKLPVARRIVAGLISGMLAGPPKSLDYSTFSAP